ncbi:MAG: hypothetical protein KDA67_12980 [Rhodobacteraceae bacterium]|nr:hypothetical protein [Paracoccaceae bacterium]
MNLMNRKNMQLLSGNHAVSWAARLCRPDVAPLYPITPQTPILEKITEFHAEGLMKTELLTPESEHSAMAACISASLTGARVFTATSSQGLLLQHELLHYATGARAAIVMCNVNRTPASPWGFWPDQLDSLSQRDTGWVQFYSESPQESLDSVIMAFAIAESVGVPTMVCHDAFYVSHSMEPVEIPDQAMVDDFLPKFDPARKLDTAVGASFGAPLDQNTWRRSRMDLAESLAAVTDETIRVGEAWGKLTGRSYGPLERYRCDDAEMVIVTMGSMCGTVRDAVDTMRENGKRVGLLKVRQFRPLPASMLRDALAGVPVVMVLDRNYSPGTGGILHQELKAVLSGMADGPKVHGLLAGIGGANVSSETIDRWVRDYQNAEPKPESQWVE